MKSLAAFLFAGVLALAAPVTISVATASPQAKTQRAGVSDTTDFSAHRHLKRHYRHHGYLRSHYRPYYYDRPVHYRPYPYASPAPFTFGIGYDPLW